MANYRKFLEDYGDLTFDEMPFCDVDNIALCQIFYMPLENVLKKGFDEPVDFTKACYKMYAYNGFKHKGAGLVLLKGMSVNMMSLAACKRYKGIKVVACRDVYERVPAVQFCAATFLLPNGETVVMYRGTDDTLVGWKEDVDIFARHGIPSHKLAADYLEEVCANIEGDVIVTGHSKGGNVALAAGLLCSDETRARIKLLYNNEGPGFDNYDYLTSKAYKELLPKYRHFIPNIALIGILLAHDFDYTVVKSSGLFGPLQHDVGTWQVNGTTLVTRDELNKIAQVADVVLHNVIFSSSEDQCKALDEVLNVCFEMTGCRGLLDFAQNLPTAVKGFVKGWKSFDKTTRSDITGVFADMGKYTRLAIKDVCHNGLSAKEIILKETK